MLIPRLDAKEVAAVFSAPFRGFLKEELDDEDLRLEGGSRPKGASNGGGGGREKWYKGTWTDWHETRWRMHNFHVPRSSGSVVTFASSDPASSNTTSSSSPRLSHFRVFGMTARILVDCARVAYAEEPKFEHNSHFGDEVLIQRLVRMGGMSEERKRGEEFERGDIRALVSESGDGSDERGKGTSQEKALDVDSDVAALKGRL